MINTNTQPLSKKTPKKIFRLIGREKLVSADESLSFDLKPITLEELKEVRRKRIPGFILKVDEDLFFAETDYFLCFAERSIFVKHLCANSKGVCCNRLSAKSDKHGGCEKVRNKSCFIEKYPWITLGYETINVHTPQFLVCRCEHFEN